MFWVYTCVYMRTSTHSNGQRTLHHARLALLLLPALAPAPAAAGPVLLLDLRPELLWMDSIVRWEIDGYKSSCIAAS